MDYNCNTGFGTVSKNIVREMVRHFGDNMKMDIFAINYHGDVYNQDDNIRVCPAQRYDPTGDVFGRVGFMAELTNVNSDYDGIFIIEDLGSLGKKPGGGAMTDLLREINQENKKINRKEFKSILYFPVDCSLVDIHVSGLDVFDQLVTYNEFSRNEVLKLKPGYKKKLAVIPHGNNHTDFFPIDNFDRDQFRKDYFGEPDPGTRTIIANINRNQPRKDIPNTIFGFMEAREIWPAELPAPFLYLHMNPDDDKGHALRIVMEQTGLKDGVDYMLCPDEYKEQAAPVELMNKIYNSIDIFVTTTTGEGWGLTIAEAFAAKVPVIATNYSSIPELSNYGQRAWLLETLYLHCSSVSSMIRRQTDYFEVAEKIIEVARARYDNTKAYQEKIAGAYNYMLGMSWRDICNRWAELFHKVYGIPYK